MQDLNQLLIFAKVVELGSFIAAARSLSLPKTTVSRKIQMLEANLGARLLQRTTRRVALTEAGAVYYDYCRQIVQAAEDAHAAVGQVHANPRGELRVAASFSFGMGALLPLIPAFMARYPEIRLQLALRNELVDLVAEGFDVAIRIGPLADSSYAVRYLGTSRLGLFASSAYVRQHGLPHQLEELHHHPSLTLSRFGRHGRFSWPLQRGHERRELAINPHLVANDPGVIKFAAVAGVGIALLPLMLIRQELAQGQLQSVLSAWEGPATDIGAVYPSRQGLPLKVRVFIDFISERLAHLSEPLSDIENAHLS